MDNYQPQSFRILPPVVKNLLILNIILFIGKNVFERSLNIDLSDKLGLHYPGAEKFHVYQFITYIFMHGDFWHIFFNMFGLYMFGSVLEQYWGAKRFLNFYFFCGIGAAVFHYGIFYFQQRGIMGEINAYLAHPDLAQFGTLFHKLQPLPQDAISGSLTESLASFNNAVNPADQLRYSSEVLVHYKVDFLNTPVVIGASGSLMGLLLAFGVIFPNTMLMALFFPVPIKAKYFVIIYGLIELGSGLAQVEGDNVAHFAHIGGMVFGFILLFYWKKKDGKYFY